jgi:hypothetical protein
VHASRAKSTTNRPFSLLFHRIYTGREPPLSPNLLTASDTTLTR